MPSTRGRCSNDPRKDALMLRIRDLAVRFHTEDGPVDAVHEVDLSLAPGETLALVGESGSGKSVTALSVLGLLPYPRASHPRGSIRLDDSELLGAPEETLRRIRGNEISMIFQEPMTSLNPLHTVVRQVVEPLMLHQQLTREAARSEARRLLARVGLGQADARIDAHPHQLSGGQRQRVMIACALANRPKFLIADEPTSALDVTVQEDILALISELQRETGMGLLLITHDLTIVRSVAARTAVMQAGRIVETGLTEDIFQRPEHAYTRSLLANQPGARNPAATAEPAGKPLLEARNLQVHYPIRKGILRRTVGHVKAVDGIDLSLTAGRTLGVVGESGCGKTTLGQALLRLIASTGSIRFEGQAIDTLGWNELRPLRSKMQFVFQDPYGALSPRLSVFGIVAEGLLLNRMVTSTDEARERVTTALGEVGLPADVMDRYPHEFSGGQRQRISIARALALTPSVLVLDEPTSALDLSVQAQIVNLLNALQARHRLAYLFISHDLRVVRAMADDLLVMRSGLAVERGPAEEVFRHPTTDYTKRLLRAAQLAPPAESTA